MGVKVDKDELENYAGEADEAGTGKFSFTTFCQERGETPGNGSKVRGWYSETGFHITVAWIVVLSLYGADTISEVKLFSILLKDLTQ